jgi:phospholipid/cholesterol/gamma-HCH transport system substrate-binding protein
LIRNTDALIGVLDANRADVIRALESLDRISGGLKEDRHALADAIKRLGPGVEALESERSQLVEAISSTGRTGVKTTKVIRSSREALLANLAQLDPVLRSLSQVSQEIPEALKLGLTIPFPAMTTVDAVKGDYANLFATIDLTTESLTESWLGGMSPATMAEDPVRGPLRHGMTEQPAKKSGEKRPDSKSPPVSKPRSGESPQPPSSSGRPETPEPEENSCLLAILGLC